jgi:predicted RNase H-like HicB family nuclease
LVFGKHLRLDAGGPNLDFCRIRCVLDETAMKHYLTILVPNDDGGWRAHFPDFLGCRAEGKTVEVAIDASAAAAAEHARRLREQGVSLPQPQTYQQVREHGATWAAERGIDWSRAIASVVKLPLEE